MTDAPKLKQMWLSRRYGTDLAAGDPQRIQTINGVNTQIATAAAEQHLVAEEINRNMAISRQQQRNRPERPTDHWL